MNEKIMKQEANYDWLKDEVHCLYAEKKELRERIDKAIEKLEDLQNEIFDGTRGNMVRNILDILKGSDSNGKI